MRNLLKEYIVNLKDSIVEEDYAGAASEMAFMLVLGIFPFTLFCFVIFGWLGKKFFMDKLISVVSEFAPHGIAELFTRVLKEVILFENGGIVAVIGFIVTLFLTSNAIAVIIKGLNRSSRIQENRTFLQTRVLSIVMVFVNAFFLFISMNLIIFGKVIMNLFIAFAHIPQDIATTILITRWPLAFLVLFLLSLLNYYVLPANDFSVKRKSVIPGAIFFTTFWLIGSWLFSLYVNELGTYNKVYGTIGTFAILMVWLYFTSIIMLIGGEINNQTLDKLTKKA